MQDIAILALVVFFVIIAVGTVASVYKRRLRQSHIWHLTEYASDNYYSVAVTRGRERIVIKVLECNDPNFEYQIEEARSEARMRLVALNSNQLTA